MSEEKTPAYQNHTYRRSRTLKLLTIAGILGLFMTSIVAGVGYLALVITLAIIAVNTKFKQVSDLAWYAYLSIDAVSVVFGLAWYPRSMVDMNSAIALLLTSVVLALAHITNAMDRQLIKF